MASSLFARPQNPQTQSNPLMEMAQAMKSGANPQEFVARMAQQNPVFAKVHDVIKGKSPQQINAAIMDICRQQGTSIQALARQLGIPTK